MGKFTSKTPLIGVPVTDRKQPHTSQQVSGRKEPLSAPFVDFMQMKACWRVRRALMVDPYGWHELTPKEVIYIQSKLADFESRTWNEIFVKSVKQNHSIEIARLRCQKAKQWLKVNMPQQTELWTLRFTGKQRVWGIFSEGAYQVLFWDPEHQIMPTLQ